MADANPANSGKKGGKAKLTTEVTKTHTVVTDPKTGKEKKEEMTVTTYVNK